MKYARALITGIDGFLGRHLSEALQRKGVKVRGFSRSASFGNTVAGDVRDYDSVHSACKGIDAVFHFAGISAVSNSEGGAMEDFEVNVKGTFNVLRAAAANNVKKVVFASSAYVYGRPRKLPMREDMPLLPATYYGQSKLAAEEYCRFFSRSGLGVVIARIFNAYGKGQRNRVIPDIVQRINASGEVVKINGNAADTRDFIEVHDAIKAFLLLAEKGRSGEAYNVATGKETRVKELVHLILQAMQQRNKSLKKEFKYYFKLREAHRMAADISKIRKLGFAPSEISVPLLSKSL